MNLRAKITVAVGALLLAAIFFVACFNVCTGLLSSCAAFFHEKFPRFSFIRWLQAFTVVSFLVSILGLQLTWVDLSKLHQVY